jgi:hypothetical protein
VLRLVKRGAHLFQMHQHRRARRFLRPSLLQKVLNRVNPVFSGHMRTEAEVRGTVNVPCRGRLGLGDTVNNTLVDAGESFDVGQQQSPEVEEEGCPDPARRNTL